MKPILYINSIIDETDIEPVMIQPESVDLKSMWKIDIIQATKHGSMFLNENPQIFTDTSSVSSDTWPYVISDESSTTETTTTFFISNLFSISVSQGSSDTSTKTFNLSIIPISISYTNQYYLSSDLFSISVTNETIVKSVFSTDLFNIPITYKLTMNESFSTTLFSISTILQRNQDTPLNETLFSISTTFVKYDLSQDLFTISVNQITEERQLIQNILDISITVTEPDLADIGLTHNKRADQNKESGEEFNYNDYTTSWLIRSPGGIYDWYKDPIGFFIINSVYTSTAMTGRTKEYEIQIGIEGCIGFDIQKCFGNYKTPITFPIPLTVTPADEDRDNELYGYSLFEQINGIDNTLLSTWHEDEDEDLYWPHVNMPSDYTTVPRIIIPTQITNEEIGIKYYNHGGVSFSYTLASIDEDLSDIPYLSWYFTIKKRIPIEISTKTLILSSDTTDDIWSLIKLRAVDYLLGRDMSYLQLKQALMNIIRDNNSSS